MFSKKATKFDKIFTADLTLCSKNQIDGEDFVNFCGLLRKHELYLKSGHEIVLFVLQGKDLFHFDLTCISPTLSCICRLKG